MSHRIPILAAVLALASCGDPPPPAPVAAPVRKPVPAQKKAETAEQPADAVPQLEYAYSPVGKRDPFRSVLDDAKQQGTDPGGDVDCGPLCKWDLEQLKLVAVVSGVSNPLAMVEDPNGRGYIVRRGTFVGKRNGKVTQIRSGEVMVTEIYKDQMGKPHINPVAIRLPEDKLAGTPGDQNLLSPEVAE